MLINQSQSQKDLSTYLNLNVTQKSGLDPASSPLIGIALINSVMEAWNAVVTKFVGPINFGQGVLISALCF